jgi:RNA polymerase sigma-70 factor (ECF subfamily)
MDHVFLEDEIKDSQLRMIFTCCHPALPMEGQLALTLKTLCGFNIGEIAAAMLTTESNINKRLYRVKEKIRNEEIPFTVPAGHQLLPRLDAVLLVIYLLFNEGYNSSGDNAVIRQDLCLEAMRLAMLLTGKPVTNGYHPVYALLALLCFHSARLDARIDTNNSLIVLEEQDRSRWNRGLISEGLQFLAQSTGGDQVTAYHLEAAIAAEHCLAPDLESTNWTRIHDYYLELEKLKPSSVTRLNLAIVTGKKDGPRAALRLLHILERNHVLDNYYLLDASLGEFYQLLGQKEEALLYFRRARELTRSTAIREVLDKKIARL